MKMKKLLSLFMASALALTAALPVFADNGAVENQNQAEEAVPYGIPDVTPPVLKSVSIDKTEVEAPGKITVTIEAEDDISGIKLISYQFKNAENGRELSDMINVTSDETSNTFTDTIDISQFEPSGVFYLEYVSIYDISGNYQRYYSKNVDYANIDEVFLPNELSFFVKNSDDITSGDIISSTLNGQLAQEVENMADNGTAHIYYGNSATLPKEVFQAAAQGSGKELYLKSDGIEWKFQGDEIDPANIKDIDLTTSIEMDHSSNSENADDITNALEDKNSIIISFPKNGQLPAPATIRIKMDHTFREYVGTENLYVYYYDNTNQKFVEVAANLTITPDSYLEFTITHNSDFVITKGAYNKPTQPENPNQPQQPNSTPSRYNDDEEDRDSASITVKNSPNGVVKANRKAASKGQTVTLTPVPNSGYVLKSLTVTTKNGKEVTLRQENGKYTFKMPEGKVTVSAEFTASSYTPPASSVKENPSMGAF